MSPNNYIIALIVGISTIAIYWITYHSKKQTKQSQQISENSSHQTKPKQLNEGKCTKLIKTTPTISKCQNCSQPLYDLNSSSEEKKCCKCDKSICRVCGIIDPGIISCQAPYICRDCIPFKCHECGRILIDENIWEEDIAYCDDCDKPFCNYNLSSNCCKLVSDETGYAYTQCRDCIKKPKITTDFATLERYANHLKDNHLDSEELDFEEWVKLQDDDSIRYQIKDYSTDIRTADVSSSSRTKDGVREELMADPCCMTREMVLRMIGNARCFERSNLSLKCEFCQSSEKEKYFMLRTHFITWECIDCAVENAMSN